MGAMTFGEKLAELREARGWTQGELAAACGTTAGVVRAWEADRREPLLSAAKRLAAALGVSLDVFPMPGQGVRTKVSRTGRPKQSGKGKGGGK
jgi:transcriptional regulator with XRE-family HTH domain